MTRSDFLDTHALKSAFLGNMLDRLVELIAQQGDDLMAAANISFPSRAVSTMLLISEQQNLTAADIASVLKQPHQLVTQRIELLLKLGVVVREPDPKDGRRKILVLSTKGTEETARMRRCLADVSGVLKNLQSEIQVDLEVGALKAVNALSERSILERTTITK
jgi:DNA-binding MarR family transcriptional regulator